MDGRGFFRILGVIVVMAILAGIGIGIYNAGVGDGVAEVARQAAANGETVTVVPAYGYGYGPGWHGWGGGFFPFGIFFWILGVFLVLGLLRAAFGRGHRYGGPGGHGPWREERERRLEAWHRAAHDEAPPAGSARPTA
jgi:hypothetical protein